MSLTRKERGTSWLYTQTYQSGSSYTDPSGNYVLFTLYDPDGDSVMSVSGTRRATGIYDCFMSTNNTTADLGVYTVEAKAFFQFRGQYPWGYKIDREQLQIVYVE